MSKLESVSQRGDEPIPAIVAIGYNRPLELARLLRSLLDGHYPAGREVQLVIKTKPKSSVVADDDPTGWKTADRLIGRFKGGPQGEHIGRDHDKHLYK